ncbi:hypothetical protein MNEG_3342 [Monoraphidium neglectum]|uniref:Uncharacterized protein n=1 Tax=Monoraphidium neglectum TaxID=145388 RepID=A0A0D2NI43_9CHLO|nr:hypothetical protein MNEG_3342 [Monoraphidium neglectum]KIZ04616.1 hypothetical protein MNEG_3342 [Monoraphidium neglectum]|eukprot:XP_013903635.1 hypothetical protein MNEG_3342 [Monoraphidium neglectum]
MPIVMAHIIDEWGVRMVVLLALGQQKAMLQPNGGVLAAPHVNAALQRLEGLDVARPAEPEGIDDTTDAAEVNAAIERLAATCVQQMPQV